jgi:uncharacterized membrane protein
MSWLRRSFITGFFVIVPMVISIAALVWIFQLVDSFTDPVSVRLLGRAVPGLGVLFTVGTILIVGAVANNVFGKRLLQRAEYYLLHVPVFKTIYAPVKQLTAAFSPDNEAGFKKVAIVEVPQRGMILGFQTKEFTLDRGGESLSMVAVYVPTNHLYLGDVLVYPHEAVQYPNITVEEGIRIFLTGGMALPNRLTAKPYEHTDTQPRLS